VLYRRQLMQAQQVAQSRIDNTTGLLNAAAWWGEAEAAVTRALRSNLPLTLIVIDVDHFSSVNETAGHQAGDQVLRDIARMLTGLLHESQVAGRAGGAEFAVVLPQTDAVQARRLAERIRDHIAAGPIAVEEGSHAGFVFRLTVSIGVAALGPSARSLADLMGAASRALGQAKSSSRNVVCVEPVTSNLAETS
jgi:diguanylate cyclase (GGDEF)-like protein